MDCKSKGSRSERKAKALLEGMGYTLVVRSGASLGLFDLVALGIDKASVLLLQIKSNRKPGKFEMELLKSFQVPKFCRKELWVFRDYERNPEIVEL